MVVAQCAFICRIASALFRSCRNYLRIAARWSLADCQSCGARCEQISWSSRPRCRLFVISNCAVPHRHREATRRGQRPKSNAGRLQTERIIGAPARSAKLSNRGRYSSALRRFGLLPQGKDPCILTTSRQRFRRVSWFLVEMPHRNRRGAHWCSRWNGNSVPRRKRLTQERPVPMPARAPPPICLVELSSC
ncbi:hypothetical protein AB7M17_003252 [Bradyrhizobium sp. USDA 377]